MHCNNQMQLTLVSLTPTPRATFLITILFIQGG